MPAGRRACDHVTVMPPLPEDTPRLCRSARGRLAGGIARGLSLHLGVSVWLVRLLFIEFSWLGGVGAFAYGLFWLLVPLRVVPPQEQAPPRPGVRRVLLLVAALGVLVLFGLPPMVMPRNWHTVLPLVAVGLGLAVLWRQADDAQRADPESSRSSRSGDLARAGLGAAVALGGLLALTKTHTSWTEAGRTLLAALALLVGAVLIGLPFFLRVLRDLAHERNERVRSQERAEVAAMMHDSVLHTLTLIQRSPDDPGRVARLARAQERELREWLYGERKTAAESFAEALRDAAAEVEDRHGVRLDVVTVGDAPVDAQLEACVAAAREAMVNAAKYAADAPISVYAEVSEERVEVFVKDRGPGFDLDAVAPDRMGVRESIVGRMRRHGGKAQIRTAPGEGTEVRLSARRSQGGARRGESVDNEHKAQPHGRESVPAGGPVEHEREAERSGGVRGEPEHD
jgi:signal transduction histidine kinase